jgi:flagella basal body P-ring formation protein FlgA
MRRSHPLLAATAALCLTLAATMATHGRAAEAPVVLQRNVVVIDGVVRLSDIFAGIDQSRDVELIYAPEPGRRTVLDYRWLARVARAYKLEWRPSSRLDRAVVERSSRLLDGKRVLDRLATALTAEGVDPDVAIALDGGPPRIYLPADGPRELHIESLSLDRQRQRFSAVLTTEANDPGASRFTVSGRYHPIMQVPVLARPMRPGEVIGQGDVAWTSVRHGRLDPNAVTELAQILGQTPRRPLQAGRPIRMGQIHAPVLVPKGSLVPVTVRRPNMVLTAQGRAKEDGARGEVIRIINLKSKKIIEAVVSGPGRAAAIVAPAAVAVN